MKKQETIDYIVDWLKNYVNQNNLQGFILGISGGIDSALTSTLCAKTGLPLLCVEMPIHQEVSQVDLAKEHIAWLKQNFGNVHSIEIDLSDTFDTMVKALPKSGNKDKDFLALANARARLRMSTLYYFAGTQGYVVAGTGNKIEDFGIGFYTKYGDGGVDINPIADLYKSEVYELSEHLGVSYMLLKAKPTDGLFGDNRSDEDQIGATYPELEWAMKQYIAGKTQVDFKGRELAVFKIFEHRHRVNQHKWEPIPVCKIPEQLKA